MHNYSRICTTKYNILWCNQFPNTCYALAALFFLFFLFFLLFLLYFLLKSDCFLCAVQRPLLCHQQSCPCTLTVSREKITQQMHSNEFIPVLCYLNFCTPLLL